MRQCIIVEKKAFANLVGTQVKAMNIIALLSSACRVSNLSLCMTAEQACELINLDMKVVEKARIKGRIRFQRTRNSYVYEFSDIIDLKDRIDRQTIYRQIAEQCVPENSIVINRQ